MRHYELNYEGPDIRPYRFRDSVEGKRVPRVEFDDLCKLTGESMFASSTGLIVPEANCEAQREVGECPRKLGLDMSPDQATIRAFRSRRKSKG